MSVQKTQNSGVTIIFVCNAHQPELNAVQYVEMGRFATVSFYYVLYEYMKLVVEATVVGLVMLAIHYGLSMLLSNQLIVVFLTGFIGHLLFEIFGANKWYCTHGKACLDES